MSWEGSTSGRNQSGSQGRWRWQLITVLVLASLVGLCFLGVCLKHQVWRPPNAKLEEYLRNPRSRRHLTLCDQRDELDWWAKYGCDFRVFSFDYCQASLDSAAVLQSMNCLPGTASPAPAAQVPEAEVQNFGDNPPITPESATTENSDMPGSTALLGPDQGEGAVSLEEASVTPDTANTFNSDIPSADAQQGPAQSTV